MSAVTDPRQFLPLKPDALLVLLVLARRERHGYGIIRDVETRSGGETRLQTGALYRLLKRLLADRLIAESARCPTPESDEERRRFYRITPLGQAVVDAEVERMARLIRAARLIGTGKDPRLA
jgi:DNA-binding PadR family transcriptional regulator